MAVVTRQEINPPRVQMKSDIFIWAVEVRREAISQIPTLRDLGGHVSGARVNVRQPDALGELDDFALFCVQ